VYVYTNGTLRAQVRAWPRRVPVAYVMDVDGEYVCCRASDDICPDCGHAACTEITEFHRLRSSALVSMARYW
jgi:hypothetical protein